jgi:hypothetical protein
MTQMIIAQKLVLLASRCVTEAPADHEHNKGSPCSAASSCYLESSLEASPLPHVVESYLQFRFQKWRDGGTIHQRQFTASTHLLQVVLHPGRPSKRCLRDDDLAQLLACARSSVLFALSQALFTAQKAPGLLRNVQDCKTPSAESADRLRLEVALTRTVPPSGQARQILFFSLGVTHVSVHPSYPSPSALHVIGLQTRKSTILHWFVAIRLNCSFSSYESVQKWCLEAAMARSSWSSRVTSMFQKLVDAKSIAPSKLFLISKFRTGKPDRHAELWRCFGNV